MKTFLFRSMVGIFFGAFLAIVMTNLVAYASGLDVLNSQMFLQNSLGFMFCGWFFSVSPLIFEMKRLRLSQQTMIHFATVVVLYFVLAFGVGWISFNFGSFLSALALFIIVYMLIWFAFYLYFKKQAEKLNLELNEL